MTYETIRAELSALYLRAFEALHKGPVREIEARIRKLEAAAAVILYREGAYA